jgi:PKD repeat protein
MRSIPLLAATSVILIGAWGCGSNSGVGPNAPVANFTAAACAAGTPCQFTNQSTPTTGLTYAWTFSDAPTAPPVTDANPTHTFAAAGDYSVTLKVTDGSGATNSKTSGVTVTAGTANQPPVASFTVLTSCTAGTPCGFHSTSTDPDGDATINGWAWDFGDPTSPNNTATTADATHTFASSGTYTVGLTVTDVNGAASALATQQVVVTQAGSQSCTTTGITVNCLLNITRAGQVKITLQSSDCELGDNKLTITAPVPQEAINNVCFQPDNTVVIVKDAAGQPRTFQAGEQLGIRFRRGQPGANDPPAGDPGIRVQGSFPNLVLNVDDGGNNAAPGEPDFNDAVLLIQQGP